MNSDIIDPQKLIEKIYNAIGRLSEINEQYGYISSIVNENKMKYSIALGDEIRDLRDKKCPVGVMSELSKSATAVVEARLKYDQSLSTLSQVSNDLQNLRAEIEAYRSLLTWSRMEYQAGTLT